MISKSQKNDENEKCLESLYNQIFMNVLFVKSKPALKRDELSRVMGKLPEIITEWKYVERILADHSFKFKDQNLKNFIDTESK